MNKKDEQEVNEAIEESGNIGDHSLQTVPTDTALTDPNAFKGMDIEGLESIPASMLAVPYVRLVQPTSKKTETDTGSEAAMGNFLFSDTQKEYKELYFVLLRAKYELKPVDANGQFIFDTITPAVGEKQQVSVLGYDPNEEKIFILSLSVTSFSGFSKLMAKLKALKVKQSWTYMLKATSEKKENTKGKFYVANFAIDVKLSDAELENIGKLASQFGVILDKKQEPEEEA